VGILVPEGTEPNRTALSCTSTECVGLLSKMTH
jgi:hypothetical protein